LREVACSAFVMALVSRRAALVSRRAARLAPPAKL
jgi:hypothetical protein